MREYLIFEDSTSPLYTSNDGRLSTGKEWTGTAAPTFTVRLDGVVVLATAERILVDAYIAGYDLARDHA